MDYLAEPPRRLFCWTVCAYKRPDLSDDYYHHYMSKVHGPLVKDLMVKYGMVKWSMVGSYPLRSASLIPPTTFTFPRPIIYTIPCTSQQPTNQPNPQVPQHPGNPRPYVQNHRSAVRQYG